MGCYEERERSRRKKTRRSRSGRRFDIYCLAQAVLLREGEVEVWFGGEGEERIARRVPRRRSSERMEQKGKAGEAGEKDPALVAVVGLRSI